MSEIQAIPEPLKRPDFDTLGDRQFDDEIEASLWAVKKTCDFCLGGRVVFPGKQIATCAVCAGLGWYWSEE